jgi:hypothetical protein
MDMEMMLCHSAVERDVEGWNELFAKTDKPLKMQSTVTPPGSAQSIMELALEK